MICFTGNAGGAADSQYLVVEILDVFKKQLGFKRPILWLGILLASLLKKNIKAEIENI